jgi:hypothetical protein
MYKSFEFNTSCRIMGDLKNEVYVEDTKTQFILHRKHNANQLVNPLSPELNPSTQRCPTRFFTGDFASWIMHFLIYA